MLKEKLPPRQGQEGRTGERAMRGVVKDRGKTGREKGKQLEAVI